MNLKQFKEKNNIIEPMLFKSTVKKEFYKLLRKSKYVEVLEYWYDDPRNPDTCSWLDVEGIGYGWIWCSNKIREKHKIFQKRAIKRYAKNLFSILDNKDRVIITNDTDENEKVIFEDSDNQQITVITFGKEPLYK